MAPPTDEQVTPAHPIITALAATLPPWLIFPKVEARAITGLAMPKDSHWARKGLQVEILPSVRSAKIRERAPEQLPRWCPELHLNTDRSFCLALAPWPVRTHDDARQWWADAEVHLRLLGIALATHAWPSHSALDHGDAGALHQAARRLAKTLDLEEEYARAEAREPSWIADEARTIVDDDGRRRHLDSSCPCGCRQTSGAPYPLGRCPRRRQITRLILLERGRRLELDAFWYAAKCAGQGCCGKVRGCPLATGDIEAPDPQRLARTRQLLKKAGMNSF